MSITVKPVTPDFVAEFPISTWPSR